MHHKKFLFSLYSVYCPPLDHKIQRCMDRVVRCRYSEHQAAVQETQELVNFRDSSAVCGRKNHCGHRAYIGFVVLLWWCAITAIADEWGPTTWLGGRAGQGLFQSCMCLQPLFGEGIKWSGSRESRGTVGVRLLFFSSLALETKGDAVVLAWNEKQFVL